MDQAGRFVKRTVVTVAGSVLLVFGIAGIFLPIVPGWALIIPGMALLATEYPWAARTVDRAKARIASFRRDAD